jgi:5-methylcytosine-specific restriction enzyme A
MPMKPRRHGQVEQRQRAAEYDKQRGSSSRRGYASKDWEAARQRVFLRDLFTCQDCGRMVGIVPGDAHCDHKLPRARGGSDEDSNLQTLCKWCHSRKTAKEDGGFGH